MRRRFGLAFTLLIVLSVPIILAQVQATHWRGAGPTPCVGSDGGIYQCPAVLDVVAIRAGHLFNSATGQMLTGQVVIISNEQITDVGPETQVKIPAGAKVIDLSHATVLPGLIDAHTHMFNDRRRDGTTEASMLIAAQNAAADLRAGFTSARDLSTHGNGYGDLAIRAAINEGRIEGPRYQVSTRGIEWADKPEDPAKPDNPLAGQLVRSVDDARAAVREQIARGADWIKLYPAITYSFTPTGEVKYTLTYPMTVLQALIDEAHSLGHKVACHVFGGEGEVNAIIAGCDTIEHALGLDQAQANMMAQKGIYYDPTFLRYTEPNMDDTDARNTGGKYRMIPIFERAVTVAVNTPGLKIMIGSGADGSTIAHGTQALEFEALVEHAGMSPARAIQSGTVVNAEALGWQDRVGSIDKGKYADIIAVAGDPLSDITELQRVKFVMKGGRVIRDDIPQAACSEPSSPRRRHDPVQWRVPQNEF